MPLTISIVTPSLNQGKFIEQTISSVLKQEGEFYIDYIIIDGGSNDETLSIIMKFEKLLKSGAWKANCLGIEYRWVSEVDQGQSDAINKGFKMAKGELLCWLNSDDLYTPGLLHQVSKVNWSKIDFIYGNGVWINIFGEELGAYPTFSPNKFTLSFTCTICQPTVFFTRQVFVALGDISTDYDLVFDYEYWLRAVHAGKKFKYCSQMSAKSRMYPENKSCSKVVTGDRERKRLLIKYTIKKSIISSVVTKIWGIRVKNRTKRMSEKLMKLIQAGGSIEGLI